MLDSLDVGEYTEDALVDVDIEEILDVNTGVAGVVSSFLTGGKVMS